MQRSAFDSESMKNQDIDIRIINLQRQLEQKDGDIMKCQADLEDKDDDIKLLTQTFEHEYELLRVENENNVLELQKTFKENMEKSRPSVHLTQSNNKHYQMTDDDTHSVNDQSAFKSDFATPNQKYTPKPPIAPNSHHKHQHQIVPKPIQIPKETQTEEFEVNPIHIRDLEEEVVALRQKLEELNSQNRQLELKKLTSQSLLQQIEQERQVQDQEQRSKEDNYEQQIANLEEMIKVQNIKLSKKKIKLSQLFAHENETKEVEKKHQA